MSVPKKRNTAPVVVGVEYHNAMEAFFKDRKVPKRYQVEKSLDEFFRKEAPEIFKKFIEKKH